MNPYCKGIGGVLNVLGDRQTDPRRRRLDHDEDCEVHLVLLPGLVSLDI